MPYAKKSDQAAYITRRLNELKRLGLCVGCGRQKTTGGYIHCPACLELIRERQAVYRAERRLVSR